MSQSRVSLQQGQGRFKLQDTFAALKYPNYRLWFFGQMTSLVGTWMQNTAQGYLVYELTGSSAFLGYVGFASGVPTLLFMLYGGVIADRIPRRNLLVITQIIMMILAFVIAGLVFFKMIQPWHVLILAFLLGVVNAFDTPARQSFAAELVDREDLTNAIALNATMFNAGAVIGPAAAGIIYALVGPVWCFTLNGVSFLAVIAALILMKLAPLPVSLVKPSAVSQVREGLQFVKDHRVILALVATAGMIATFGMSLVTLIPAWAVDVLQGDVKTNGILLSARGLGAMGGALTLASIGRRKIRGKMLTTGTFLIPVIFVLFALLPSLPLSIFFLILAGFNFMMVMNSANALVQTNVPDALRGRIMSIYAMTFMGGMPFGQLLIGMLAAKVTEPAAVLFYAAVLFLFALFLWLRVPSIRELG